MSRLQDTRFEAAWAAFFTDPAAELAAPLAARAVLAAADFRLFRHLVVPFAPVD
jgi:hypothetical protein